MCCAEAGLTQVVLWADLHNRPQVQQQATKELQAEKTAQTSCVAQEQASEQVNKNQTKPVEAEKQTHRPAKFLAAARQNVANRP